jgi:hypothetical protein
MPITLSGRISRRTSIDIKKIWNTRENKILRVKHSGSTGCECVILRRDITGIFHPRHRAYIGNWELGRGSKEDHIELRTSEGRTTDRTGNGSVILDIRDSHTTGNSGTDNTLGTLDITENLDVSDTIETDAVIFLSISPDKGRHHKLFGRTELKEDRVGGHKGSLDGHTGYIRNRDSIGSIGSVSRKHITGRVSKIEFSPSTILYLIGRCGITISGKGVVNGSESLIIRLIGIKVSRASPHSAIRLIVRQTEHLIHNIPNIAYNSRVVDSGRDSRALLSKRERSEG